MKQLYLLTFFTICFTVKSSSQTLSLFEMQKVLTYNVSDFEDFVLSKGYKFSETEADDKGCDSYTFSYDRNRNNPRAKSFIDFIICPNRNKIHQQFSDERKYLEFKKLIKSAGYVYYNSRNEYGTILSEYYNKKYQILLMSKKTNDGLTIYAVTFAKINK